MGGQTALLKKLARGFLVAVGLISAFLGFLGVFLPLLPTTPFLLLAAACFSRSSEKFNRWLLHNRLVGEYLRNYREGRGITLQAKVLAISLLWLAMGYSLLVVATAPLKVLLPVIGVCVTVHLLKLKTLKEDLVEVQEVHQEAEATE